MEWLNELGFWSWAGILLVLAIAYTIWAERKHSKTPMGKKQKAWIEELKKHERSLRYDKKNPR